jgi:hypothetical protein
MMLEVTFELMLFLFSGLESENSWLHRNDVTTPLLTSFPENASQINQNRKEAEGARDERA